jgi:single-strand DNA-binding protein
VQQVMIIGNLGRDPELRYTANGRQVLKFSVAVNTRVKPSADEEYEDHTEWFSVQTMGNTESLSQRLVTGTRVFVQGDLQLRTYTRRDGSEGKSLDVWAKTIEVVSRATSQSGDGEQSSDVEHEQQPAPERATSSASKKAAAVEKPAPSAEDLDDLPF